MTDASLPEQGETSPLTFSELELAEALLQALDEAGYENPTPIQAACIPTLLDGNDVIGQAQTGSGKTAAFSLPMLNMVDVTSRVPQALVLCPTRELASQVADACRSYGAHLGKELSIATLCGGQSYDAQNRSLKRGSQIIVGTPGRVMDHIRERRLRLNQLQMLVLDEADEMLKMGFIEDIEWVLEQSPEGRQMALFSATMPPPIQKIAERQMIDPELIRIQKTQSIADTITQQYVLVYPKQKQQALVRLLEGTPHDGVMIFVRTKSDAIQIAEMLLHAGYSCSALQGDMAQRERDRTVERLKRGDLDIVVATDVAARGLDVERVNLVVNYEAPNDVDSYVHRVGRTGRAGRIGHAILLLTPSQRRVLQQLEKTSGRKIEEVTLPSADQVNDLRVDEMADQLKALKQKQIDKPKKRFLGEGLVAALREASPEMTDSELAILLADKLMGGAGQARDIETPDAGALEKGGKRDRGDRGERGSRDDSSKQTYSIGVGRQDNVSPKNIIGAMTNEGGVDFDAIGRIQLQQQYTLVDIDRSVSAETIESLRDIKVGGRFLNIREWRDSAPGSSKGGKSRPGGYGKKKSFGSKKPFGKGGFKGGKGKGKGKSY